MHIISITLAGYRQFLDPVTLEIPEGITGICGPNGVGKSKLVEAIGFALYGVQKGILPRKDKASDLASRAGHNVTPKVTLRFEISDQRYELVRSGSSRHCVLRLEGVSAPLAETTSGVTSKMIELLRLTPDAFLGTFVARQREIASLQALNDKARERLVNRLIGISLIEKAMLLSQTQRADAKTAFEAAQTAAGERVEAVEARLETARHNEKTAGEGAEKATKDYQDAQAEETTASRSWEVMQKTAEQYALKKAQVDGAENLIAAFNMSVTEAETRVQLAAAAEQTLIFAREELADTEGVDEAVTFHELQITVIQEREVEAKLQSDLTAIRKQHAEKDVLLAQQAAIESETIELQSQLNAYAEPLGALKQALSTAQAEEQERTRRKAYVLETGPGGVCDRCGQRLGENLEQALQHLEAERADAQRRIDATIQTIAEHGVTQATLQDNINELAARKKTIMDQLKPYENAAKEKIRLDTLLHQCSERISKIRKDAQEKPYEPDVHEADKIREQRRRAAESSIATHSQVALGVDEARQTRDRHLSHVEEKAQELESLRIELTALVMAPEVKTQAEQGYKAAKERAANLFSALNLARSEVSKMQAHVEDTERELEQAHKRWQGIKDLQFRLVVAERTADLMRQLLIDISSEARPRITELMEGWAQALMGPHFQHIALTPDYRICADNGSGLHELDHFSGGEQTLLAIMLRVAISLYCQERAGYPSGVLILDEVFGDQDENHRAQLVQFLEEIRPNYQQILVVNHVTEVTEMLNSIITVIPIGECRSTAAVRI